MAEDLGSVVLGISAGVFIGTAAGTFLGYKISSWDLRMIQKIGGDDVAAEHVRKILNGMDKKGWLYNNVFCVGARIHYENFLRGYEGGQGSRRDNPVE